MKYLLTLFFVLFIATAECQEWVTDNNFEEKITGNSAFDDLDVLVVVEFYADFNKENAFKEWSKLLGVKYYRANIVDTPLAKKKYRIRMAPTIIIFDKEGYKYKSFKAGLDLICPVNLVTLQASIEEAKKQSQY